MKKYIVKDFDNIAQDWVNVFTKPLIHNSIQDAEKYAKKRIKKMKRENEKLAMDLRKNSYGTYTIPILAIIDIDSDKIIKIFKP